MRNDIKCSVLIIGIYIPHIGHIILHCCQCNNSGRGAGALADAVPAGGGRVAGGCLCFPFAGGHLRFTADDRPEPGHGGMPAAVNQYMEDREQYFPVAKLHGLKFHCMQFFVYKEQTLWR